MKNTFFLLVAFLVVGLNASAQQGMGVGNNNPQEMLDVTGAIKIGTTTNTNAGTIRWNGTNFQGYDGAQWVNLDGAGGADSDWTVSSNDQYSTVSGNVGIGISSPLAKLHLNGPNELLRLDGTSTNVTFSRWRANGSPRIDFSTLTATGGQLTLYNQSGTYSTRIGSGGDSYFRFGNVGIGTDAPSSKLEVVGQVKITGGTPGLGKVLTSDADGLATWQTPAAGGDSDWSVSGVDQYSAVSGNVGVGTSSPLAKMHIDGANELFRLRGTSTNVTMARYYANSSPRYDFTTLTATGGQITLYDQNGTYASRIGSGGNSFFRFGNVGIGTDNPTNKLHMSGSGHTGAYINAGSGFNSYVDFAENGTNRANIFWNGAGDFLEVNGFTGNTVVNPNGGNVGIGSFTPGAKLEVAGQVKITGGTPGAGKVLTSDAAGLASWSTPAIASSLADADNDTKIQVEETSDDDIIRFDVAGSERWIMTGARIEPRFGGKNVFIGEDVAVSHIGNPIYQGHVGIGKEALNSLLGGIGNIAIGWSAMASNQNENHNIAIGTNALTTFNDGSNNIAVGSGALEDLQDGNGNVAIGIGALSANTSGISNVALGRGAGGNATGDGHIFIGVTAGLNATGSNKLYIDNTSTVNPLIYGEFDNDLLRVNGTLNVNNAYSFPTADGTNGYIMTTNGSGTVAWTDPANISDGDWTANGNDQYSAVSGNVGIGTTTPTAKLEVASTNDGDPLLRFAMPRSWLFEQVNTGSTTRLQLRAETNSKVFDIVSPDESSTAASFFARNAADGYGEVHLVAEGGNVGIGTTAPSQKLHIQLNNNGFNLPVYVRNLDNTSGGNGVGIGFLASAAGSQAKSAIFHERIASNNGLGKLHLVVDDIDDANSVTLAESRLTVTSQGNVGIGTTAPAAKLDVAGTVAMNDNQIRLRGGADGNHFLSYIGGSFDGAKLTGNNNVILNTITGGDALIVTGSRVGIGTASPVAPLHVEAQSDNGYGNFTFYAFGTTNVPGTCCGGTVNGISIHASGRMMASEFDAFSDARIKNVIGLSNTDDDLQRLLGIQITDYRMKDKAKDFKTYKKVIAQQVEDVYPEAVSRITDVVPNIYAVSTIEDGYIAVPNELKEGDRVKLIFNEGAEMVTVLEADLNGFRVDLERTDDVFVYGQEVSDFRTVDYEAIAMLNVSATQELFKLITKLQSDNQELKDKLHDYSSLKSDVELLKEAMGIDMQSAK